MKATVVLKVVGWVLFGLVAATGLGLALGFPVMWLWNWLMPELFHLPAITFWQAVGLLILSHLLFKGHYQGHGHWQHRHGKRWSHFANDVRDSIGTDAGSAASSGSSSAVRPGT